MKKIIIFLVILIGWQCSPPRIEEGPQPIYIYDSGGIFHFYQNSNDSLDYDSFVTKKAILTFYDTILIGENYKIYTLFHYRKYIDCKDTTFKTHVSFLDSISYFDGEWLSSEVNLDSLWKPVDCWRCSGIYDSAKIYLILPIENSDSIKFLQVHRWFHQTTL